MTQALRPRLVAVADSDSYVKWAAATLGAADGWRPELAVLETPLVASPAQQRAALRGSGVPEEAVTRTNLAGLLAHLRADPPDAVLLAARGPVVRVLARAAAELHPRPVIVSGLPGIAIPATRKALVYRAQCDLLVLHSHRERREFAALAAEHGDGVTQRFALATLPFLQERVEPGRPGGTDLVFAAQAVVPRERADRERVARLLVRAAAAHPERRVVVKLRAVAGERQTHDETDAYPELLAALGPLPPNLVLSTAPMADALDEAEGLLTVSSTAAIEAVAREIPVLALDTFGVSAEMINLVFAGSGLLGDEDDVIARRFRHADPRWRVDNYLHSAGDDDWRKVLAELVALRRAGVLPSRAPWDRRGGALRDAWERKQVLGPLDRSLSGTLAGVVGVPLRGLVRMAQRMLRARPA
ncbi:hypothetical protein QWJ90_06950 [Microbacterium oryzae]|uniref:DUF6716 putative glycosyltransferase n=1 Tax=Microbacterium oryzae TaxID=743009 RepID=UPI0025B00E00|nr:DUF6716 putative glycosyltransferase [Microbacterium oryzae]MDN3310663.1 hypothetical protein [Microbacterium oryzae]